MSVKLSRYALKKIGGVIVPIRRGAEKIGIRQVRILPQLAPPDPIGKHFNVAQKLKDAHFHLQRKGSEATVGTVRKGFEAEDIGIKVKDTGQILPKFAQYAFDRLKMIGFWKDKAHGTTALKNLKASTVKATSVEELFPTMKDYRKAYEAQAVGSQIAVSRKATLKLKAALDKGGKLVSSSTPGEARLVSGVDRRINARGKGITFRKINGRIVPVRNKG